MFAHATIVGRLGQDPELKEQGVHKVCNVNVAVDHGYGERKTTSWIRIAAWNKQAEGLVNFCRKGTKVLVDGELRVREYTDNAGNKRQVTEIIATEIRYLDPLPQRPEAAPPPDDLPSF